VSDILWKDRDALNEAIDNALPDDAFAKLKKKAQDLADHISKEIEYNLRDHLSSNLAYHAKEMAGRAVTALLEGNEAEMIRWLSCDTNGFTGRSDGYGTRSIEQQHPVIHGNLFEQGCVLLRKKIAEAHKDLIASERIKDLEDQVASLVAQNNKLQNEIERWRDRALDRV
jgi:hypothetical protein